MSRIIRQSIGISFRALQKNKLRTVLSILGTAIGITSIIVILSAGESLKAIFLSELEAFGTDYIQIEVKIPNTAQASTDNAGGLVTGISVTTMKVEDKDDIVKLDNVRTAYAANIGQASIQSIYDEVQQNYFAVSHEYDAIDPVDIESGRFFSREEEDTLSKVVVLGSDLAHDLFPNQDPVGQSLRVQKVRFRVIGVFESRGSTGFLNLDEYAFIPLKTAQKLLLGFDHISFIVAQLYDVSIEQQTAAEVESIMRANHEIFDPAKDDFAVTTQSEANELIDTLFDGVTLVLAIIASIALVVGGVGIMNIMYVAVSERVFEIGLRKAVGATAQTIRSQFLIEAIVITFLGGVFGVLLALVLIVTIFLVAGQFGFNWPFAISPTSIVIGLLFSTFVGLFFGYFPAKAASELKPVEALTRKT